MSLRVAIGALCTLATLSTFARAATDPEREWITLRSTHFAIHTYGHGEELGRRVATYAEDAWETLNPILGWEPTETIHIRLVDDMDASNGLASVMPYPVITIWAHPPAMDSDLSDHADWLRLLIFHEYAHIAHLDHATGLPRLFNTVFGKVIKPNGALPRWFTEGIATWAESRVGQRGRLDSSRYRMMIRMAALEGVQPSLPELTGKPLRPPRGDAWYLYGGYLVEHMVRHTGPEALRAFIEAYGRRLVGYGMNIISRQSTGADLVQWHQRMLTEVSAQAEATRKRVMAEGLKTGRQLTRGGEGRRWPRFTPDGGHLVYVRSDAHSPSRLVRVPLEDAGTEETIIACDGGCGRFVPTADGTHLLATMGRPHRKVNHYRDLVRVRLQPDLRRGDVEPLTRGFRAGDPTWGVGEDRLLVVRNRWGRTWLEVLDAASWSSLGRWEPPQGARIDGPVVHPDGRVFLSMHHQGNRDLVELKPDMASWVALTSGASLEIDPVLSPDGRWLLYASDTTGIYNLYARDVSTDPEGAGRTFRLTNVLGGAFSPTISPHGGQLVYVGWTAHGDELFSLPFEPEQGEEVVEPDSQPLRTLAPVESVQVHRSDYEILPTLLPRSWAPSLVVGQQGVSTVGLSLTGRDASRRVATALSAEWSAVRRSLSASAGLDLGLGWSDLRGVAGRYTADQVLFAGDRFSQTPQEVLFATLGVSSAFPSPITSSRIGASWTTALHRALEGPLQPDFAPDAAEAVIPAEGVRTSVKLSWAFDGVRRYPYSISRADGFAGGASFRLKAAQPVQRGLLSHQLRYHLRGYGTLPWLEDHVLAVVLRGGWSGGEGAELEPFRLGGTPTQDLVSTLMQQVQTGSHWLRGYPANTLLGTSFHLLTGEYRLPLGRIRQGLDTLPIFARDLSVALFHDLGVAYSEPQTVASWGENTRGAVGAELRLTTDLLFALPIRMRLGWAWGWGLGGGHQGYLVLAADP